MKKTIFVLGLVLLLSISLAYVHANEEELAEAKKLIDSGVGCDKLTDEQLEGIGEYAMEQMHPGEGHEAMHQTMGLKEGTEAEEQFHISMARMMYCDQGIGMMSTIGQGGMMGQSGMQGGLMGQSSMMGQGGLGGGMMGGGGMMNMMYGNVMGQGIMGSGMAGTSYSIYWSFLNILYIILLVGLVVLVYLWIIKLWKSIKNRGDKK